MQNQALGAHGAPPAAPGDPGALPSTGFARPPPPGGLLGADPACASHILNLLLTRREGDTIKAGSRRGPASHEAPSPPRRRLLTSLRGPGEGRAVRDSMGMAKHRVAGRWEVERTDGQKHDRGR